jgi:hypothetical protein
MNNESYRSFKSQNAKEQFQALMGKTPERELLFRRSMVKLYVSDECLPYCSGSERKAAITCYTNQSNTQYVEVFVRAENLLKIMPNETQTQLVLPYEDIIWSAAEISEEAFCSAKSYAEYWLAKAFLGSSKN